MLRLPEGVRDRFKKPFGVLHRSLDEIIPLLKGHVVYTVGDVVTYNLVMRGMTPDIAIIDGYTMRVPCRRTPVFLSARRLHAKNPAGTLTDELITSVRDAVRQPPAVIFVDGEEDLAVIPLVLAAPEGAIILYGQPWEGVVVRIVDSEAKVTAASLLNLFVRE